MASRNGFPRIPTYPSLSRSTSNVVSFCNKDSDNSDSYSDNLISWWYETIEIPLVVENVKSLSKIRELSVVCDFISIPPIYWNETSDFDDIVKILN